MNILDRSDTVTVVGSKFTVNIEDGQPKVYYPTDPEEEDIGMGACCTYKHVAASL